MPDPTCAPAACAQAAERRRRGGAQFSEPGHELYGLDAEGACLVRLVLVPRTNNRLCFGSRLR